MSSTSAIGSLSSGAADLAGSRTEDPFTNHPQEVSFKLALAGAAGGPGSATLCLDQSALNAADEAWVNFVAISEQLQKPHLSQDKQNGLLADLADNLRTFREQSAPLLQQVDNFFASRQTSSLDTGKA